MEKIEGQICQVCGQGVYVKNPYTGKIFCENKCWLNNGGRQPKIGYTGVNKNNYQTEPISEPKQPNWDAISFGKCKHAYLLEAYKRGEALNIAEPEAEKWAEASMRKLEKPQLKDFGNGKQVDNIPF